MNANPLTWEQVCAWQLWEQFLLVQAEPNQLGEVVSKLGSVQVQLASAATVLRPIPGQERYLHPPGCGIGSWQASINQDFKRLVSYLSWQVKRRKNWEKPRRLRRPANEQRDA